MPALKRTPSFQARRCETPANVTISATLRNAAIPTPPFHHSNNTKTPSFRAKRGIPLALDGNKKRLLASLGMTSI